MENENDGFVSLGDVWGGKREDGNYSEVALTGINHLVPPAVPDKAMACGGRWALHQALVDRRPVASTGRKAQCSNCEVVGCELRIA